MNGQSKICASVASQLEQGRLEAVRANRLWCFTHHENRERVERRWRAMSDAFDAIPPV